MATTVMVAAVRVSTVSRPHQVSTGYCAVSSSAMMRAHGLHLGGEARVALHHRDVAEHVADAAVDVVVILLDGGLAGAGLCAPRSTLAST